MQRSAAVLVCCPCAVRAVASFELREFTAWSSAETRATSSVALQLGYRFSHVLRRMLPIAMYLLQKEGAFLTGHDLFLKRVGAAYHAFLEDAEARVRLSQRPHRPARELDAVRC